jgi:hypothetical protein
MRAVAFHPASQSRNVLAAAFGIVLSVMLTSAAQAQTVQQNGWVDAYDRVYGVKLDRDPDVP